VRIMWTGGQFCLLHFAKPDLYSRQFYKSDSFEHQAAHQNPIAKGGNFL